MPAIFDWQDVIGQPTGQTVTMHHEGRKYWLVASPVGIVSGNQQYQAMCNAIRVTKTLFGSCIEAKDALEEWYKRTVLGEVKLDAKDCLTSLIWSHFPNSDITGTVDAILEKFKVELR